MRSPLVIVALLTVASSMLGCSTNSTAPRVPMITHLYVADFSGLPNAQIYQYVLPITSTSTPSLTMPSNGANFANWLAFDTLGDLFAMNSFSPTEYITAYATPVSATSTPFATIMTSFTTKSTVAVGPGNLLWACNEGNVNGTCVELPPPYAGSITPTPTITLSDQLHGPSGLAWDASGDLFVANSANGNIVRFNAPITNGETNSGILSSGLTAVNGLVFDSAGNLYASSSTGRIVRFNSGNLSNGATPNFTDTNTGSASILEIAIDPNGNLYATDFDRFNILVFTSVAVNFSNSLAPSVTMPAPAAAPEAVTIGP